VFGARPPRLRTLPPQLADFAADCRARVRVERLRADVEALARPRSRLYAPEEIARVEGMLLTGFRDAGWEAERRPFTFDDVPYVEYVAEDRPEREERRGRLEGANVVALKRGSVGGRAFLVGAHFDSMRDTPGADDNASGVAALLELARILAPVRTREDLVVAAFDMEEVGFFGSQALAAEEGPSRIAAAIVLECIGYSSLEPGTQSLPPRVGIVYREQVRTIEQRGRVGDWTLVIYRGSSSRFAQVFAEALAHVVGRERVILTRDPTDLPVTGKILGRLVPWTTEFIRSDHNEFWKVGIPAIQVTDTANFRNPHYHQPTDTPETLDYDRMAAIVVGTAVSLAALAGADLDGRGR
jgi:hypothetical protein